MGKASIPPPPMPDPILWKDHIRDLEHRLEPPSLAHHIEPNVDETERQRRRVGVPPPLNVLDTFNLVGGFIAVASSIGAAAWWLMATFFPIVPASFQGGTGF